MKQWELDETSEQRSTREAWKEEHRHNEAVTRWLIDNPTPDIWEGDAMDWAFLEYIPSVFPLFT